MSYDNVCKMIAEKYPLEFVRWLLPVEPQSVSILKTELSIEPIRADSVIFLQVDNRILHIEFQTRATADESIPFRMLDYSVRLKRIYGLRVTQVVIFLQEIDNEIVFTNEYEDENTVHRYRVARMWEQKSARFLNNEALLPLAALTETNSPLGLLSQVAQKIATILNRNKRQDIAAYTEILAGLRFEKDLIRSLLSEDIMQESVIYQDILQKGEKRNALSMINRLLNRRFSQINPSIVQRVQELSVQQIEDLGEALLDFNDVSDLETWLNRLPNN